jgi:hypothetical protein
MKTLSLSLLTIALIIPTISTVNGNAQEISPSSQPSPQSSNLITKSFLSNPLIAQSGFSSLDASSFFDSGRLRSEDQLRFQRPPANVPPVRNQSQGWQFVIFKEGGVSFWVPPGIVSDESVTLKTVLGEVKFRTLTTQANDRRYVAAYANDLTAQQVQSPGQLLNALRDRVAPADKFKLATERSITLNKYPGKELSFVGKETSLIFRAYLVGNRAYVVGVIYPNADPQPRSTRAFLNALELLNPS